MPPSGPQIKTQHRKRQDHKPKQIPRFYSDSCGNPEGKVFFSAQPKGAPASLLHNIRHNRVLHQRNLVLTIVTDRIPYVQRSARVEIKDLSHGFFRIIAHFGFMETPTIGEVIQSCALKDFVIEEQKASFFSGVRRLSRRRSQGWPVGVNTSLSP